MISLKNKQNIWKQILIIICALISITGTAQQYWVDINSTYIFSESHATIKCSDGGYASTGSHRLQGPIASKEITTTKFDAWGNIVWDTSIEVESGLPINVGIVEVNDDLFVVTTDYFSENSIINRYDKEGEVTTSSGEIDLLINDIVVTSEDKLLLQYRKGLEVFLGCFTLGYEKVWEVELENTEFSLFDGFGFIDDMDNYQCIVTHKNLNDRAIHYIISPDGIIVKSKEFSLNINMVTGSGGICFAYLNENTIVTLPQGNLVGGEIHLSKIDLNTYEVIDSFFVFDYITYSEEIKVIDEMIYVGGASSGSDYPGILILNNELEYIDRIQLESKLLTVDPFIEGANLYDLVNTGEGILFCGSVLKDGTSHGYLTGHVGYNGAFESVSVKDSERPTGPILFPNPTSEEITVAFDESVLIESYRLISVTGSVMEERQVGKSLKEIRVNLDNRMGKSRDEFIFLEIKTARGVYIEKVFWL